jgi:hypothetical protein
MISLRYINPQESRRLYNTYQKFKTGEIETNEVISLLSKGE